MNRHPDNNTIVDKYNKLKNYVTHENERRKAAFEYERIQSATGDDRKIWKIYKEVLFNRQTTNETDITIDGALMTDSENDCNRVNEHFCSAGEELAKSITEIHGYGTTDLDYLYPEYENNNFSFRTVTSEEVAEAIIQLPDKKSTSIDKVPTIDQKHCG